MTAPRRDALRAALPATVDHLQHCRAAAVEPGDIDDYVALDWLEWHGGTLRLTTTGRNVCRQLRAERAPDPADDAAEHPAPARG